MSGTYCTVHGEDVLRSLGGVACAGARLASGAGGVAPGGCGAHGPRHHTSAVDLAGAARLHRGRHAPADSRRGVDRVCRRGGWDTRRHADRANTRRREWNGCGRGGLDSPVAVYAGHEGWCADSCGGHSEHRIHLTWRADADGLAGRVPSLVARTRRLGACRGDNRRGDRDSATSSAVGEVSGLAPDRGVMVGRHQPPIGGGVSEPTRTSTIRVTPVCRPPAGVRQVHGKGIRSQGGGAGGRADHGGQFTLALARP